MKFNFSLFRFFDKGGNFSSKYAFINWWIIEINMKVIDHTRKQS
jgi:hypothetical protein